MHEKDKPSAYKRFKSKLPLPIGCFGVIFIGIVWIGFGIRGCIKDEEESDRKYRAFHEAREKEFKSKFSYDIDSVAREAIQVSAEGERSNNIRKGLSFTKNGDKFLVRTEPLYQMPEENTAYNLKDLDVVVFQEYSKERSDHNTMGEREVLDIVAVDMKSKKIFYRNSHPAKKISYSKRRSGVTSYYYLITRDDVLEEFSRIFQ
jgi:hypothetical protein